MKLSILFLLPEGLRHKLMFVCPTCSGQTFLPSTRDLAQLHCSHCGDVHDARDAEVEVLSDRAENPSRTESPSRMIADEDQAS